MAEEAQEQQSPWDIDGEQEITLAPGQGLPGFPAGHGPGIYLVDYKQRTIRPKPVEVIVSGSPPLAQEPVEPVEQVPPLAPITPALNQNQATGQGLPG